MRPRGLRAAPAPMLCVQGSPAGCGAGFPGGSLRVSGTCEHVCKLGKPCGPFSPEKEHRELLSNCTQTTRLQ